MSAFSLNIGCQVNRGTKIEQLEIKDQNCPNIILGGPKVQLNLFFKNKCIGPHTYREY